MKVVLDSNIFVSSFFWKGNPRKVFDRITKGFDELYITNDILTEIFTVMSRDKFKLDVKEVEEYLKIIESYAIMIFCKDKIGSISRDKDDDKILQCGLEGNVDYIITGDNDLLELKEYEDIKIIKPKEFLEMISSANGT